MLMLMFAYMLWCNSEKNANSHNPRQYFLNSAVSGSYDGMMLMLLIMEGCYDVDVDVMMFWCCDVHVDVDVMMV